MRSRRHIRRPPGRTDGRTRTGGAGRLLASGLWLFPVLLLVLSIGPSAGAADPARVLGRVFSSETGEPLPYANLVLKRLSSSEDTTGTLAGGAVSAQDGTYRLVTTPGRYNLIVSYISYATRTFAAIEVGPDSPVTLDIALTPSAIQLETVQVTAKAIKDSEVSILAQQRRAPAVSDGMSAQEIRRSSDSNAAEVLQRVTGLSIVGGRYVFVRGLGERYSSTQIDGASVGTPEPNKRVVPLDIFAAGLLDRVTVQKTYTPDQPGEFGGGVVNLSTRDFPGRKVWEFSASSGYNSLTTGKDFQTYAGGKKDFLGFDDGSRDLPDVIEKLAGQRRIAPRSFVDPGGGGFSPDTVALMGRAFSENWSLKRKTARPAYNMSASYGNEVSLMDRPLGFLGSLSLNNSFRSFSGVERFFKSDGGILTAETDYDVRTSQANTLWGALANSSYRVSDFSTVTVRTMYNRSAEDEARFYEGDNQSNGKRLRNTRLRYVERGLFAGSVGLKQFLGPLGGSSLDLRYSYSRADRAEPDRREYDYELQTKLSPIYDDEENYIRTDTLRSWQLSTRSLSEGFSRMFGSMTEDVRGPEAHLTIPLGQSSGREFRIKTGALYRNKDRDSSWRRLAYRPPSLQGSLRDSLLSLSPDQLLTDERIGGGNGHFVLEELTRSERDNYRAHSDLSAGYAMADLPFSISRNPWLERVRLVVGARIEHATMEVESFDLFGLTPDSLLRRSRLDDTDVLPSVNLTLSPREEVNLRLGYSATVSRPDLRELSDFGLTDFVSGYEEMGNPDLKRSMIHNFDLRLEFFPGVEELLAGSLFYKRLIDPIERSIRMAQNPVYQPINGEGGSLAGLELDSRMGLGRIHPVAQDLALSGNLTLVRSETQLDKLAAAAYSKRRPLEGQSPYVVNLGLFHGSGKSTVALLYNASGRRLAGVGLGDLPDIYERPRHSLDLALSRRVGGTRLKLSLENLLDQDAVFEQEQRRVLQTDSETGEEEVLARHGHRVTRRSGVGRSVSFTVSMGS